jgi:predicted CoA-substrate-specific enzyme activase
MFLGIDLGSRFIKIVYGKNKKNFNKIKFDTIHFYTTFCLSENNFAYKKVENSKKIDIISKKSDNIKNGNYSKKNRVFKIFFDFEKLKKELKIDIKIKKIVATGYGRNIINFENISIISEIVAHYLGVKNYLEYNGVKETEFIILDIGGQDTKIISVRNGILDDFFMNDKCAAGSGRYFEQMSNILNMPFEKMNNCYENFVNLSNTCAIFGESEIISHIVKGERLENIASGVNYSIFSRLKNYLEKFEQKIVIFIGGMNRNFAIKYFIENNLEKKKKVICLDINEYNGAFGCFCESLL